ncbi:LysR family transcriptional regulator [Salinifilum ghardaiensis]
MESRPVSSANLDPNLLVALEHLLRERSVPGAAERMRLSQPALSATSARPRRHFDDELLARDRTPRSWWRVSSPNRRSPPAPTGSPWCRHGWPRCSRGPERSARCPARTRRCGWSRPCGGARCTRTTPRTRGCVPPPQKPRSRSTPVGNRRRGALIAFPGGAPAG